MVYASISRRLVFHARHPTPKMPKRPTSGDGGHSETGNRGKELSVPDPATRTKPANSDERAIVLSLEPLTQVRLDSCIEKVNLYVFR